MILSQLLEVDRHPELLARWNFLYARAREIEEGARSENAQELDDQQADFELLPPQLATIQGGTIRRFSTRNVATGLALFCCGIAASEIYRAEPWLWFYDTRNLPLIVLRPHVSMVVGESLIIHGERGDCGKLPPDWEYVLTRLPVSRIGEFSDGGIVRRNSNFCKGETPARAVTFTAKKPGVEEFLVLGDVMRVSIAETPL